MTKEAVGAVVRRKRARKAPSSGAARLLQFWGLAVGDTPTPMGLAEPPEGGEARWWSLPGAVAVARGGELLDVAPRLTPRQRERVREAAEHAWSVAVYSEAHCTRRSLTATVVASLRRPHALDPSTAAPRPAPVLFPFLRRALVVAATRGARPRP
jgi:hypothetical protein